MTSLNRGFWLSTAALAVVAMGCGDLGGGGDAGNTCSTDANCGTGRVCHPVLKECVSSCTGGSDCPASAKTCARLDSTAVSASTPGFCQCSTDALCNGGTAGSLVCSNLTKQCTSKCTANSQCPSGATCDTATGQCKSGGTTDAGTDAGVTDAGVTCNSNNPQPDTCGYGSACTSANTCEGITDGTCSNVTSVAGRTAWSASTSTGPVIFNVVDEATDDAAACASGTPFTTTVYAYAGGLGTFPAQKSNLPGFFYYTTSGNAVDVPTNLLTQSNYTVFTGSTVMGAKFTVCSTSATSSIQVAFGFTNGNGYCTTLTH